MVARSIVLTDSQHELIDRLVSSGRFQDASDAVRAGLRLLENEEIRLEALRTRLVSGLAEARAGDLAEGSGEEVIRRAFAAARGEG